MFSDQNPYVYASSKYLPLPPSASQFMCRQSSFVMLNIFLFKLIATALQYKIIMCVLSLSLSLSLSYKK